MDLQTIQYSIQSKQSKLNRALDQITLLDNAIQGLKMRYNQVMSEHLKTMLYHMYDMRLCVLGGTRSMYLEYAQHTMDKLHALEYELMETLFYDLEEVEVDEGEFTSD